MSVPKPSDRRISLSNLGLLRSFLDRFPVPPRARPVPPSRCPFPLLSGPAIVQFSVKADYIFWIFSGAASLITGLNKRLTRWTATLVLSVQLVLDIIEHVIECSLSVFDLLKPVISNSLSVLDLLKPVIERSLSLFDLLKPVIERSLSVLDLLKHVIDRSL